MAGHDRGSAPVRAGLAFLSTERSGACTGGVLCFPPMTMDGPDKVTASPTGSPLSRLTLLEDRMSQQTCIVSSIVLDDESEATEFPSAGQNSASSEFQLIYWQCIALCLMTSIAHNPDATHILFCNRNIPDVAPAAVTATLSSLGVEFVQLPLSYRLPAGSISRWGNVFYVLDIVRYFVETLRHDVLILTDADCVWRKSADGIRARLADHDCLLYSLKPEDQKNYEGDVLLNGMSRRKMVGVLEEVFDKTLDDLPPHNGGEFFAANRTYCTRILPQIDLLWAYACAHAAETDSIKTEEHFLNIIAWRNDIRSYTANDIVRRLWTNFGDVNVRADDANLAIWHLPAEKKFGFRRMWRSYARAGRAWTSYPVGEVDAATARFMGVPRRSAVKLGQDLLQKVTEKLSR